MRDASFCFVKTRSDEGMQAQKSGRILGALLDGVDGDVRCSLVFVTTAAVPRSKQQSECLTSMPLTLSGKMTARGAVHFRKQYS